MSLSQTIVLVLCGCGPMGGKVHGIQTAKKKGYERAHKLDVTQRKKSCHKSLGSSVRPMHLHTCALVSLTPVV